MKKILGAAMLAAVLTVTMTACEVPEDGKTAADGAADNQKKKDKPAKTEKAKSDAPKETAAQENARESAETYLDVSAFSRQGLIDQLEFEDYSTEDATYAVDKIAPDFNEQAAKSAEAYLDLSGFSRQSLIDQLVFEGYTDEQAAYGADSAGL